MYMRLSEITEELKEKYDNITIETNYHLIQREAKLIAIDGYKEFSSLDDVELREALKTYAIKLKEAQDEATDKESEYRLACGLEVWYDVTDRMKQVKIVSEAK